jgi:hypothetical protein
LCYSTLPGFMALAWHGPLGAETLESSLFFPLAPKIIGASSWRFSMRKHHIFFLTAIAALGFAFTACGGGGGSKDELPTITTHPAAQTVNDGQQATFSAAATGKPAPTFQWEFSTNGAEWRNVSGGSGATTNTYTTAALAYTQSGNQYRMVAKNSVGEVASNAATLTVNPPTPTIPAFTSHPQSLTRGIDQTAHFTAAASGYPAPTYHWQISTDGSNWANVTGGQGGNTNAYTTHALTLEDNGNQYRAVATNSEGVTNSNAATLTVTELPPATVYVVATVAQQNNELIPNRITDMDPVLWKDGVGISLLTLDQKDWDVWGGAGAVYAVGSKVHVGGWTDDAIDLIGDFGQVSTRWEITGGEIMPKPLTDGVFIGTWEDQAQWINSIWADGTNVYSAGHAEDYIIAPPYVYTIPTLWRNDTFQAMGHDTTLAWAKSVFVSGGTVRVAGVDYSMATSRPRATLWSSPSYAPSYLNQEWSEANAIFVSGADTYVAGFRNFSQFDERMTVWKNSTLLANYPLVAGTHWNAANGMFVDGDDVYVVGEAWSINEAAQTYNYCAPVVWKKGAPTVLTGVGGAPLTITGSRSYAWSVYVLDDVVYVAGCIDADPTLWIDGVATPLDFEGGFMMEGYRYVFDSEGDTPTYPQISVFVTR